MNQRTSISAMLLVSLLIICLAIAVKKDNASAVIGEKSTVEEVTTNTNEENTLDIAEEETEVSEEVMERPTVATIEYYDVNLPKELQKYIIERCEVNKISPALVMAIIERESDCNANAVGDNGKSLGLMQIQPKWHQWRADKLGCKDWYNPYDNVAVGIDILSDLFGKYGDDVYSVLMAYNGGPSYVARMEEQGKISKYAIEVNARAEELEQCDVAREEKKIWE